MNLPSQLHRNRSNHSPQSGKSIASRLPFRIIFLALLTVSLVTTTTSFSQTVTANFGGRSGSTPEIPSGLFAVGGNGVDITAQSSVSALTSAGLTGTRFWIPLSQIYATSTPDFNYLDSQLKIISASGLHPMGVIYLTPPSLASSTCAPPSNVSTWGKMAASVVAHVDQKFPGLLQEYEIWNEPELASSLCVSDPTARLNTYVAMFAAAASAMHAQAQADGQTIRTGGPVISQMTQAPVWIPALLNNESTAQFVDFVSFHLYITGQNDINNGMTWSDLYSVTQSSNDGLAHYYQVIDSLVRAGKQPNAASTPIYLSEYNNNWAYAVDCCRNDPTYAPLWNSLAITDFLDVVYNGASAVPSRLAYFNSIGKYFCIMGQWDSDMDCNPSQAYPYPQFYAFQLFASANFLNLQAGGNMAASVSPASTTSGLSATAFYTKSADDVVIVNPTSTPNKAVNVTFSNPGLASVSGTLYLLNGSNSQISGQSVSFSSTSGGYSATIEVPAYSTVAFSMQGSPVGAPPTAVLNVTPQSGSVPLEVSIDSSESQGGGSPITGRTIDFGDGTWLNWTPTITHTYSKAGTYAIRLSVKNQDGQLVNTTTAITVH
jgi:PKD repeat protein